MDLCYSTVTLRYKYLLIGGAVIHIVIPIYSDNIVIMIKEKPIWIVWRLEKLSNDKTTKVPYQINGQKASSIDPRTWSTYKVAKSHAHKFSGLGIILSYSVGVIGIDFDHCVVRGEIVSDDIKEFINKANTYCEYSPSGTGLHLLFETNERIDLERNKQIFDKDTGEAMEIYTNGRYFTYTENEHPLSKPIRTVDQQTFLDLLKTIGYPWKTGPNNVTEEQVLSTNDLNDQAVLDKMFSSKYGDKLKRLYDGDISEYNNDQSSADFALCLNLAFWTSKNSDRIKSIWLSSPLGQRQKTQNRTDYQERTIQNAIKNTASVYVPNSHTFDDGTEFLTFKPRKGEDPVPILVLENICRVLETDKEFKGMFRLNDHSHLVETKWKSPEWQTLSDRCIFDIMRIISCRYPSFIRISKNLMTDAIISVAYDHSVNPPKDYFSNLVWDGKPRLNSWLHHVYGVADDELNQAIGSNWIKGLIKRVMQPGCIFDEVLALESKQGWRKSTSIRELGAPWHVETTHSMDDKDFYMILAQNIIVEFSEGEIFDRTSIKKLKAEVTKTEDQFRPPYERGMMKFKRSCVFAVTTNDLQLKDDTGNRRWLPVSLEKPADIDWIKENRDQLFAEAYHRVIILGETTHEYPGEALEALQSSRSEWSEQDEKIMFWYASLDNDARNEGVSVTQVADALGITRMEKKDEYTIASSLKRLGLESKAIRISGAVVRRWLPTEKSLDKMKDITSPDPIKNF